MTALMTGHLPNSFNRVMINADDEKENEMNENEKIQANAIRPGMILAIYGNKERFDVEAVEANEFGAVIVTNWSNKSRGLDENETVEILGYFNPSGIGKL